MPSVIEKLLGDCIDFENDINKILRRSKVIAKGLNLLEFEKWISKELNGYDVKDDIPKYRIVKGNIKALLCNGMIPVNLADEFMEVANSRKIFQSTSEIEELIKTNKDSLLVPFVGNANEAMCNLTNTNAQFYLEVHKSQFKNIIDQVVNTILEWAMKFNEDGIKGDGFSFTEEEILWAGEIAKKKNPLSMVFNGNIDTLQIQNENINSHQSTRK